MGGPVGGGWMVDHIMILMIFRMVDHIIDGWSYYDFNDFEGTWNKKPISEKAGYIVWEAAILWPGENQ